jgi:hypothetical protein
MRSSIDGAGTLFALSGGVFTPIDLAMAAGDKQSAAKLGKPLFVQIATLISVSIKRQIPA